MWQCQAASIVPRGTSGLFPASLAPVFTEGFQVAGIAGDAVVVYVLLVRQVIDSRALAYPKCPRGALSHVGDFRLLILKGRAAEAIMEQLCGNGSVLLANLHIQPISLAVDEASLCTGLQMLTRT